MGHPFRHLRLILRHRHRVIANAAHCGIFWQSLRHDLSKFSYTEFHTSAKYYAGDHSPVFEERLHNDYFSTVCQHHTKRNKHHWEYWTDFFSGRIVVTSMPWNWAMEYVCDMVSASYCYNPKEFKRETPYNYFMKYSDRFIVTERTKQFMMWALGEYKDKGWAGLKKNITKAKYAELAEKYPKTEMVCELHPAGELPSLKSDI